MAAATLLLLLPLLVDSHKQMSSTQLSNRALPEDLSGNMIAHGEWRTVGVEEHVDQSNLNINKMNQNIDKDAGPLAREHVEEHVAPNSWPQIQDVAPLAREGESRIVGGSTARFGAHPWGVAFVRGSGRTIFCGGALVSKDWVLTAAHCVASKSTSSYKVSFDYPVSSYKPPGEARRVEPEVPERATAS